MSGSTATTSKSVTAVAPGKVILFGEHAINRGQPAIAVAVGLYARCTVEISPDDRFHFRSGTRSQDVDAGDVRRVSEQAAAHLRDEDFAAVRALSASDYFAPQKYVLGYVFQGRFPYGLSLRWESEVPPRSGLGSGASAFVAMAEAVCELVARKLERVHRGDLALRGETIAHGGIASALDTQTSLLGGVIEFTGSVPARRLPFAEGLTLVIGDTRVGAATGEVNARVRRWLDERPAARTHVFRTVGALSRAAVPALERGDWDGLGRLMNLNQLVLEKIGVSCPEADRLIAAALEAGALGAKVSGSGGGGIIVALATPETKKAVADAITEAGGNASTPEVAVPGVRINP